uniref:Uncharacterized protein n=1 Tax=Peronospora matthiolae TaxID=2874970 RepID=A0AAV1UWU3_9STRA
MMWDVDEDVDDAKAIKVRHWWHVSGVRMGAQMNLSIEGAKDKRDLVAAAWRTNDGPSETG